MKQTITVIIAVVIISILAYGNYKIGLIKKKLIDKELEIEILIDEIGMMGTNFNSINFSNIDTSKVYYRYFSHNCQSCIDNDTTQIFNSLSSDIVILSTNYLTNRDINEINRDIEVSPILISELDLKKRPYVFFVKNGKSNFFYTSSEVPELNRILLSRIKQ